MRAEDIYFIVGSLCGAIALLVLVVALLILLKRRGSAPSRAYEEPAMPPMDFDSAPAAPSVLSSDPQRSSEREGVEACTGIEPSSHSLSAEE